MVTDSFCRLLQMRVSEIKTSGFGRSLMWTVCIQMNILGFNNEYEWMRIGIPNQYTVNIIYPEKSGFTVRALKPGQANKIPKRSGTFKRLFQRLHSWTLNFIGPLATKLDNLLFWESIVIGQSSLKCPGLSVRTLRFLCGLLVFLWPQIFF